MRKGGTSQLLIWFGFHPFSSRAQCSRDANIMTARAATTSTVARLPSSGIQPPSSALTRSLLDRLAMFDSFVAPNAAQATERSPPGRRETSLRAARASSCGQRQHQMDSVIFKARSCRVPPA
jgi:hypothetical protein